MEKVLCWLGFHKWFVKRQTERFKGNRTIRTKVKEIECTRCGERRR